jgi:hypothetical protein
MKHLPSARLLPALIAAALLSTGCMDSTMGVNDTDKNKPTAADAGPGGTTRSVEGTVATGAFAAGVKVQAFDSKGSKCGEVLTDANGAFRLDSACAGPLLLVSEAGKREGDALYSIAPGSGAKSQANITSLTSLVVALAVGDHPRVALRGGFNDALAETNIAAAQSRLRGMLAPALAAFSAENADFLSTPLVQGAGMDALMDQADFRIDVDPDIQQYSIWARLPSLQKPIVLRNRLAAKPGAAWFDEAYGKLPSAVSPEQVAQSGAALQEISSWFAQFAANPAQPGAIDSCFRHDGTITPYVLFLRGADGKLATTNLRLLRYNTHGNLADEDFDSPNAGAGTLAYISADQTDALGRKVRYYTWLIKGSQMVDGCASSGTGWRLLGNQHRVNVQPISYAQYRIEYGHTLNNRVDEQGTGLEFYVTRAFDFSHVQVNGPGLPASGVVLVNKDGAFVRYNGTLISLRTASDMKQVLDSVMKPLTRSIALTDEDIAPTSKSPLLGITDALFDEHNTYTFRLFRNKDDRAPELVYTQVLEKRPYVSTELGMSYFPVLAVHLDQLMGALARFEPATLSWSPAKDLLGNDFELSAAWLSRFATWKHQVCEPPPAGSAADAKPVCSDKTDPVDDYVLPGSFRNLRGSGLSQVSTQGLPANGTIDKGYAHFEVLDSYRRPVRTVVGVNLTR